jgi:hypothetical protein
LILVQCTPLQNKCAVVAVGKTGTINILWTGMKRIKLNKIWTENACILFLQMARQRVTSITTNILSSCIWNWELKFACNLITKTWVWHKTKEDGYITITFNTL